MNYKLQAGCWIGFGDLTAPSSTTVQSGYTVVLHPRGDLGPGLTAAIRKRAGL